MTATTAHLFRLVQAGAVPRRFASCIGLNVIHFTIPPLRERREDIPDVSYRCVVAREDRGPRLSASAARRRLIEYAWPGNIRELRTVTRRLSSATPLPDISSSRSTHALPDWQVRTCVFREAAPQRSDLTGARPVRSLQLDSSV